MTRHSTDRTNEESRQAYEAMNLRERKVHRMTRDVAKSLYFARARTARTVNLRGSNGDAPSV
jgi:hypothetical protein